MKSDPLATHRGRATTMGLVALFYLSLSGVFYTPWLRFWSRFAEVPDALRGGDAFSQGAIVCAGVLGLWLVSTIIHVWRS